LFPDSAVVSLSGVKVAEVGIGENRSDYEHTFGQGFSGNAKAEWQFCCNSWAEAGDLRVRRIQDSMVFVDLDECGAAEPPRTAGIRKELKFVDIRE
jgi:hypothetical protein